MTHISQGWQKQAENLRDININNFTSHGALGRLIRMKASRKFIDYVKVFYNKEYQRIKATFKEHPALLGNADDIDGLVIGHPSHRYIGQLCPLLHAFPEMKEWKVLEVGAGFGGFGRILKMAEPTVQYSVLDIKVMADLAKAFIGDVNCYHVGQGMEWNGADLFVSMDCLSETTESFIDFLIKDIFPKCKNFYIYDDYGSEHVHIKALDWIRDNTDLEHVDTFPSLSKNPETDTHRIYIGRKTI